MSSTLYTIALTPEYGYVLLSGSLIWLIHNYLGFVNVGSARRKYKVPYGLAYEAPKETEKGLKLRSPFNYHQRGHMHLVENLSTFYFLLLTSGVFSPVNSAIAGAVYGLGSLIYAFGYTTKPQYRVIGELVYLPAELYLLGNLVMNAWKMARSA